MKSSQFIYLTQLLKERKDRKQNTKIYRDINTHKYTIIIFMKYDFFLDSILKHTIKLNLNNWKYCKILHTID